MGRVAEEERPVRGQQGWGPDDRVWQLIAHVEGGLARGRMGSELKQSVGGLGDAELAGEGAPGLDRARQDANVESKALCVGSRDEVRSGTGVDQGLQDLTVELDGGEGAASIVEREVEQREVLERDAATGCGGKRLCWLERGDRGLAGG